MYPDGIQGPPSPSPSPETPPTSVGSQTAPDSTPSITENCKLPVEEIQLGNGGLGAPFCPDDESHLRILQSPSVRTVTPLSGSRSVDISENLPSSVQVMHDNVHATPEKVERGSSASIRQRFKTPSPPQTRRRYYDSLISPGKEAVRKAESTNTVFYRPDLDELEEWTKANVSPAVFGQPSYRKPLAGPTKQRSAIRCNLRMLSKAIKLHPTSTSTTNIRSHSFTVQYLPQSLKSERMIESIFGSALDGTESKSESVSRVSLEPDAESANLYNEHHDVTHTFLDPLSQNWSSENETSEDHQSEKLPLGNEHSQTNELQRDTSLRKPPPSSLNSTPFPPTIFKADLSNPLHQPGPTSPTTPKLHSSLPPAPNGNVKNTLKSLSDPSFNPDFPLTLSPAIQRSALFPLSPCSSVFQAPHSATEQPDGHVIVASESQTAKPYTPDNEEALASAPKTYNSQHIFVSLPPLSTSPHPALPASSSPKKSVRYVQLHMKSPMAPPIWNEVEALPSNTHTEPPDISSIRKPPLVLESEYLQPRFRDLWATDASNDFSQQAKSHMTIAKVLPIFCMQNEEEEEEVDEPESDELESDELESDELGDDTMEVEVQDSASGVVFLSPPYGDESVTLSRPVKTLNSWKDGSKSGLDLVVDAMRREGRGSATPHESASTRRSAKRTNTISAQEEVTPSKRRRVLEQRDLGSEDESDRPEDVVSPVKQHSVLKTRTQRWTSLIHAFLKGKRRLEQVDLHDITQALREIKSDPESIVPNSPLAGYIRMIANLQSSDIPDDDRLGWRPLAENILRFWGPEATMVKVAAGSGSAGRQPVVLSSSGQ